MKTPLILLPLAALSLSACGYSVVDAVEDIKESNDGFAGGKAITTDAATTGAFTKLEALGPDNIVFVTGDAFSIKAEGSADALKKLRYKVENGTIIIGREKGKWWGKENEGVTITVTAPALTEASLAGSGDFTADKMAGDKVVVEIAGSGNVTVADVTGKKVESSIAGSGDVKLAGKVESAEFEVAGSGSVDATKLASVNAEVSIAGSGDVSLTASGMVDADIAGSGDVTVTGGAKCKSSTMGSGSVNCG
jgi:Putative auto-transporter adhesin, head GIN domain